MKIKQRVERGGGGSGDGRGRKKYRKTDEVNSDALIHKIKINETVDYGN